jgi:hypothetical protein
MPKTEVVFKVVLSHPLTAKGVVYPSKKFIDLIKINVYSGVN